MIEIAVVGCIGRLGSNNELVNAYWCANTLPYPFDANAFEQKRLEGERQWSNTCFIATDDDGKQIGYFHMSINDAGQIRSFIVPGGDVSAINHKAVRDLLKELKEKHIVIGGISADVDLLDDAGILNGLKSTHSTEAHLPHHS